MHLHNQLRTNRRPSSVNLAVLLSLYSVIDTAAAHPVKIWDLDLGADLHVRHTSWSPNMNETPASFVFVLLLLFHGCMKISHAVFHRAAVRA